MNEQNGFICICFDATIFKHQLRIFHYWHKPSRFLHEQWLTHVLDSVPKGSRVEGVRHRGVHHMGVSVPGHETCLHWTQLPHTLRQLHWSPEELGNIADGHQGDLQEHQGMGCGKTWWHPSILWHHLSFHHKYRRIWSLHTFAASDALWSHGN